MHLSLSSPPASSGAIIAITLILYMWSAMDSGPSTPLRTHPVRFVAFRLCSMRKKSTALRHDVQGENTNDDDRGQGPGQ